MSNNAILTYEVKSGLLLNVLEAANQLNMSPKATMELAFQKGLAELLKGAEETSPAQVPEPPPQKAATPQPRAKAPSPAKRSRGRPRVHTAATKPAASALPPEARVEGLSGAVMSGDYSKCDFAEAAALTKHVLRLAVRRPVGDRFSVEDLFTPAAWATMDSRLRLSVSVRVSNAVRFSGANVRSLDSTRLIILDTRGEGNRAIYKIVKFSVG